MSSNCPRGTYFTDLPDGNSIRRGRSWEPTQLALQRSGEPTTANRFSIIRVLALLLMVIAVGLAIVFAVAPSLIVGE